MSDLLRRDIEIQPRPPRGEQHRARRWWLALAKRQGRATQSRRMNTRLGRRGAGVQREPRVFMQRSVVKVSYARNARLASWAAHGRYLARAGAQRDDDRDSASIRSATTLTSPNFSRAGRRRATRGCFGSLSHLRTAPQWISKSIRASWSPRWSVI
jgi:hypothetical protein